MFNIVCVCVHTLLNFFCIHMHSVCILFLFSSNSSESWSRSLPRQNDNKTNTLSSRVPVGPWRRTASANSEQATTRKFLNTPVPQRRSSHPKTS